MSFLSATYVVAGLLRKILRSTMLRAVAGTQNLDTTNLTSSLAAGIVTRKRAAVMDRLGGNKLIINKYKG